MDDLQPRVILSVWCWVLGCHLKKGREGSNLLGQLQELDSRTVRELVLCADGLC